MSLKTIRLYFIYNLSASPANVDGQKRFGFLPCPKANPFFGNLVIFIPCHMHRKRYPILLAETIDSRCNLLHRKRTFRRRESRVLGQIQVIQIFCLVYNSLVPYNPAIIIDKNISHDGKHPTFEIDIVDIFIFVVESFKSRILKQIFRFFPVCGKHISEV